MKEKNYWKIIIIVLIILVPSVFIFAFTQSPQSEHYQQLKNIYLDSGYNQQESSLLAEKSLELERMLTINEVVEILEKIPENTKENLSPEEIKLLEELINK